MNNITKTLSSKSELESKISPTHNTKQDELITISDADRSTVKWLNQFKLTAGLPKSFQSDHRLPFLHSLLLSDQREELHQLRVVFYLC